MDKRSIEEVIMRPRFSSAVLLFLLVPFFRPEVIAELYSGSIINKLFLAWRVVSFAIVLVLYFVKSNRNGMLGIVLLSIYELEMLLSVWLNHVSFKARLIDIGNAVGVLLICLFFSQRNYKQLIKVIFYLFCFEIMCNAVFTIIYPYGFNRSYGDGRINFLGGDNYVSSFFVLAILSSYMYWKVYNKKIMPIMILSIIILTELYYFSGTGIVACAVALMIIFSLELKKKRLKLLNIFSVSFIFGLVEYMIVFVGDTSHFSFIFKVLNKSSDFSTRTYFWKSALSDISLHPVWGKGSGIVDLWDKWYYSHNALLDVLLKGGIIGSLLLLLLLVYSVVGMNRAEKKLPYWISAISLFMIPMLLIGLMEGLEDRVPFTFLISAMLAVKALFVNNYIGKKEEVE